MAQNLREVRLSKGARALVVKAEKAGLNPEKFLPEAEQEAQSRGKTRVSVGHMDGLAHALRVEEAYEHARKMKWPK